MIQKLEQRKAHLDLNDGIISVSTEYCRCVYKERKNAQWLAHQRTYPTTVCNTDNSNRTKVNVKKVRVFFEICFLRQWSNWHTFDVLYTFILWLEFYSVCVCSVSSRFSVPHSFDSKLFLFILTKLCSFFSLFLSAISTEINIVSQRMRAIRFICIIGLSITASATSMFNGCSARSTSTFFPNSVKLYFLHKTEFAIKLEGIFVIINYILLLIRLLWFSFDWHDLILCFENVVFI